MDFKCLFETRGESVCSESAAKLIKLSECRDDVDDQLQTWHLSKFKGTAQEYELIVNKAGLLHDLSSDPFSPTGRGQQHRIPKFWVHCLYLSLFAFLSLSFKLRSFPSALQHIYYVFQ